MRALKPSNNDFVDSTGVVYNREKLNEILKKIQGDVLYSNSNGSNTNITLSANVSNYKFLEIYYHTNDPVYGFVKVDGPLEGKRVNLSSAWSDAGNLRIYFKHQVVTITGNHINLYNNTGTETRLQANLTNVQASSYIYITKVIGYNF